MTDYKFPTDLKFRKKAAYIADKVMYALNVAKINFNPSNLYSEVYCPLGCLRLEKEAPRPSAGLASIMSDNLISLNEAIAFIRGYDGGPSILSWEQINIPMYQLGLAYRKRFVK